MLHRLGEVGVDDQRLEHVVARSSPQSHDFTVFKMQLLDGFVQANIDTHVTGDHRHFVADRRTALRRVKDAVLILQKCQNREEAGTLKWEHSEVLGIKNHRPLEQRSLPQLSMTRRASGSSFPG